jgi:hypothetical protein
MADLGLIVEPRSPRGRIDPRRRRTLRVGGDIQVEIALFPGSHSHGRQSSLKRSISPCAIYIYKVEIYLLFLSVTQRGHKAFQIWKFMLKSLSENMASVASLFLFDWFGLKQNRV